MTSDNKKEIEKLRLAEFFEVITDQESLDALPDGSIVICQTAEYEIPRTMIRSHGCCGGWHEFNNYSDSNVFEISDDYTPVLPALVVHHSIDMEAEDD